MSFHIATPQEPITVILLLSNLLVWTLHLFLRRQTTILTRNK